MRGYFIEGQHGRLFLTQFGQIDSHNCILCLPSIFEEMNLSRAVVAKTAQSMADHGWAVFCLDYFATGDSEGEIQHATADMWLQDILYCIEWLKAQGAAKVSLWGIRLGALLALNALPAVLACLPVSQLLLWKPVSSGKLFMTQFLRLKQANTMIQGGERTNWRTKILDGEWVEVSGYPISASFMQSIEKLSMPDNDCIDTPAWWFELSATTASPATQSQLNIWKDGYCKLILHTGVAFWQTPEIFVQPTLHELMLAILKEKC